MKTFLCLLPVFALSHTGHGIEPGATEGLGTHGFADSDGVKIHYVTKGEGELLILIHGFPDFWFTWREQMPALSEHFQVVAIDMRGYNESDKPEGVANYKVQKLVGDVAAVAKHFGKEKAIVAGHDWGGMVAWSFAMAHPEMTDRLVILNLPHPKGLNRELAHNPEQQKNSQYARDFQRPEAAQSLTPEMLADWVKDPEARKKYVEAFKKSDMEAMLNFYKANYPREPYTYDENRSYPPVGCPVLMFHGLKDKYLLSGALSGTWDWVGKDLTLVTIPDVGHFVQQDAAELVTKRMLAWLMEP
jgi:pimeloyl-ACP methyl ester carboxylesterase